MKFCDPISSTAALSSLDGVVFQGRKIVCDNVEEKEKVKKKKGKRAQALRDAQGSGNGNEAAFIETASSMDAMLQDLE